MKKFLIILMTILILILMFTGCTSTQTPETRSEIVEYNGTDYFPVLKNTHLSYSGVGNEYADREIFFQYVEGNYFQMRVSNSGTTLAQTYKVTDSEVRLLASYEEIYFSHNFINEVIEKENSGEVLLKKPFVEGNKWTLSDGREREITGVNIQVETPHQTYEAIEVTTRNEGGSRSINYYAVGLGLVKAVHVDGEFEVVTSLERVVENATIEEDLRIYYPDFLEEQIVFVEEKIQLGTNDDIKKLLEDQLKRSPGGEIRAVMGENARINTITFDRDQWQLKVDFDRGLITEMQAGVYLEGQILTSIGNTFGDYFNVDKVFITIDGLPYESGHIMFLEGEYLTPRIDESVRMPLIGQQVFNPREIQLGEKIVGLTLKEFQTWKNESEDYPYDDYRAKFEGKVELTGNLEYRKSDFFYSEDMLFFHPNKESAKKLPVAYYEKSNQVMVFENQDYVVSLFKIEPGETITNLQIEIEDYTAVYLSTDALNSGSFVRQIN